MVESRAADISDEQRFRLFFLYALPFYKELFGYLKGTLDDVNTQ